MPVARFHKPSNQINKEREKKKKKPNLNNRPVIPPRLLHHPSLPPSSLSLIKMPQRPSQNSRQRQRHRHSPVQPEVRRHGPRRRALPGAIHVEEIGTEHAGYKRAGEIHQTDDADGLHDCAVALGVFAEALRDEVECLFDLLISYQHFSTLSILFCSFPPKKKRRRRNLPS